MQPGEETAPRIGNEGPTLPALPAINDSNLSGGGPDWSALQKVSAEVTDEDITQFFANRTISEARQDIIKSLDGYSACRLAGVPHANIESAIRMLVDLGAVLPPPSEVLRGEKFIVDAKTLERVRRQIAEMGNSVPGMWYALEGMVTVGMLGDHEPFIEDDYSELNRQLRHEAKVLERFEFRSADDEARQLLKKKQLIEPPSGVTLTELLAESDEPLSYRMDHVWPSGGRVITAAQRKAGKTTLSGNITKCLVDGVSFLGEYPVVKVTGSVALLDFEMSRNMLRAWYRDLSIQRAEDVYVWPLRGLGRSFDIRDPEVRAHWVEQLQIISAEVLIIDCLAPIFSALSINEKFNEDVGPLLDAIDALIVEAGVTDCMIMHHMGHGPERSRGASRLRDWPEVEWKIVRALDEKTGEAIDNGPRFFSAYGRDVEVDECELTFARDSRSLIIAPEQRTRAEVKASSGERYALEAATIVHQAAKPLGVGEIKAKMKSTTNNTRQTQAIALAVEKGWLSVMEAGSKKLHSVGSAFPLGAQMNWAKNQRVGE